MTREALKKLNEKQMNYCKYLLYEFEDGTKIYERIDAHALDSADMSDVIMQYDHEGRVFARKGLKCLCRGWYYG